MDNAQRSNKLGWACDRCRRQKLRCDIEKPCILCVRAGVACEPQLSTQPSSSLKRKRSSCPETVRPAPQKTASPASSSQVQSHVKQQQPTNSTYGGHDHARYPASGSSPYASAAFDVADRVTKTSPSESQQYGANDSTMGFAKILLGDEDDESDSPTSGIIPGDAGRSNSDPQFFAWISTPLPSQSILQIAVDAYFERVNWYIMIFHQSTFTLRAQNILRRSAWRRDEVCDVLVVAMVAVLGLRCVEHDRSWPGHQTLAAYSVTAESLRAELLSQVGSRFYEVMLDSRIEVYQICMLLTTYHVYFGSSSFAWNASGVSTKTAYALALHCDQGRNPDKIAREVANRCWNHLVVSDQFSSMIFGRPAGLDPAFAQLKKLAELDDTELPESTAALPILRQYDCHMSLLNYHTLKFELYEIIRQTLQSFRVLQLQNPVSVQDLTALIQILNTAEGMLKRWQDDLPPMFQSSQWPGGDPWCVLELDKCTEDERNLRKKLGLQGFILQLLYDAAIVWAHRPLLKLRISISPKDDIAKTSFDDIPDSLNTSVQAALRMSRVPVHKFEGHLGQSFVLMHLFTAGIILCVAPTCQPYSLVATEAKAGVLRIIAACRAIKDESKIAMHTDRMLTRLYKKTMQREMDNALRGTDIDVSRRGVDRTVAPKHPQAATKSFEVSQVKSRLTPGPQGDTTSSVVPQISTGSSAFLPNGQRVEEPIDQPVVSYLQFDAFRHGDGMTPSMYEQFDEAYGAFEQMFNLDFAEFPFNGGIV